MGLGNHYDNIKKKYNPKENVKVKNDFKSQIMIYEDPLYLPDTIVNFPLDGKEVDDFSGNLENIRMNDYKMAFSPPEDKELVKEKDYPSENIEYSL